MFLHCNRPRKRFWSCVLPYYLAKVILWSRVAWSSVFRVLLAVIVVRTCLLTFHNLHVFSGYGTYVRSTYTRSYCFCTLSSRFTVYLPNLIVLFYFLRARVLLSCCRVMSTLFFAPQLLILFRSFVSTFHFLFRNRHCAIFRTFSTYTRTNSYIGSRARNDHRNKKMRMF